MTVKTKLKSDDWFKSYGLKTYPLGSPLGAGILCIPYRNSIWAQCGPHLELCGSHMGHPLWTQNKVSGGLKWAPIGLPMWVANLDPIHFVPQVAMGLATANYVIPYYSQFMLSK